MAVNERPDNLQQPGEQLLKNSDGSAGLVETKHVRLFDQAHKLHLESGQQLGPIDVAYETYGKLNERKDNAILICHALSGDAHVAGRHKPDDRKPGWWDNMVGPGKPFDTNKYFIIGSNNLGGCMGTTGPTDINPETNKHYGLSFPIVTIGDMVEVQRHLVDYLGIERLLAVAGGSMGGMTVLDWAIRYPDRVAAALPIATTARLSAQGIAFNAVGRNAIITDRNFQGGDYYDTDNHPHAGLAVARMIGHITYLSEEAMRQKFGRRLQKHPDYQYELVQEFSVETYLDHQGSVFVDRFDANTYVYFTKAMDYFDLARQYGSLPAAFSRCRGRFLVISFKSDWLFPPRASHDITNALIKAGKDVTYCDIDCPYGHDSFLLESEIQGNIIRNFLEQTHRTLQPKRAVASPPAQAEKATGGNAGSVRIKTRGSIFAGNRVDHRQIAGLIEPNSKVLDLGCGDGELLALLRREKNIRGMGITLGSEDIQACVKRGVSVVEYDISTCLANFADKSYDYVVLSQTLQVIREPKRVLLELLRIGKRVIISFPNFAYWRGRLRLVVKGRAPVWKSLPYEWFNKPAESVNYMSITDVEQFVQDELKARLIQCVCLSSRRRKHIRFLPNLLANEAIFVITGEEEG